MPPSLGGSGHYPVPRRQRYYAALRLPHSHQSSLRFHLARIYHACRHCSGGFRHFSWKRSASPHVQGFTAPQPVGTLSPVIARGGMRASQVPGSSSSSRAAVNHPAWLVLPSPSFKRAGRFRLQRPKALGRRWEFVCFEATFSAAQMFAYLRIAGDLSVPVARLTTGLPGSALTGVGFAPTGRQTEFVEITANLHPL